MAKMQKAMTSAKAQAVTTKRIRRPAAEMLADLKAQRHQIAERLGARIAKLDERIAKVESRYERQIQLAALTDGLSEEDLARKLEETRHMQKLLRLAMKGKA